MYFGNEFERFIREAIQFHPGGKISLVDMNKIKYLAAIQNQQQVPQSDDELHFPFNI
jgi:hypothetical protein